MKGQSYLEDISKHQSDNVNSPISEIHEQLSYLEIRKTFLSKKQKHHCVLLMQTRHPKHLMNIHENCRVWDFEGGCLFLRKKVKYFFYWEWRLSLWCLLHLGIKCMKPEMFPFQRRKIFIHQFSVSKIKTLSINLTSHWNYYLCHPEFSGKTNFVTYQYHFSLPFQ